MTPTLAEQILPARGAAQKATASFAEQLADSPGRSDVESPSSSNPFREPTHRTKSVKYRYSATGKHLSSPLMGSSSSPERKQAKSRQVNQPMFTPAPSSHAAKAPVATTSRKRTASFRKEDTLSFLSSPSPLSSAPTTPLVSTKALPGFPAPRPVSLHSFGPTASKFSVLSQPLSPKRKQKKDRTDTKKGLGTWDVGNSVWILVNQSGVLVDTQSDLQMSESLVWWPAQVVQKRPLRVSMFGDFPSSSSTSRGLCTIFAPSSSNIQTINDDSGVKRFTRATFRLGTSLSADDHLSPPAKKPRLDEKTSIEDKWESAVQSMEKASTLERDGLPALLSSYTTTGGSFYDSSDDSDPDMPNFPTVFAQAYRLSCEKVKANRSDMRASIPRSLSPCPPDPTLQIPGELVLAMAPKTGGSYWPAQILEHAPDRKEKYKVKFLDDEEHVITRDRFWTSEEEGFVLCTLGEWESAVKTIDDPDSGDEGGEYDADDDANDATLLLPPPPPAKDFEDLSVRTQLAYVKPVLRAILNKEYAPAREKHEAFMKGGSRRAVQKAICEWVLGNTGIKPERLDVGDVVAGASGAEEAAEVEKGATVKAISPEVVPAEILPCDLMQDDKMEGIEGAIVPGDVHADENDGTGKAALPLSAPDNQVEVAQDSEMVVDGQEQQPVFLPPPVSGVALSPTVEQASLAPKSQLDDASPQPSPLTPIPDEDKQILSRKSVLIVCEEFETLSGVEKLDYCLNILLPESIQQLLLWRSGERTSSALLPPEEEQRLHEVAARKAAQTDWVDDVMRLRAAQARLWGVDPNKKAHDKRAEVVQGGTRSRPRRGTVSRP
ncbi:hypothetical protein J3R83DRAFT_4622 [Lanmaoa asiatica]|nr:hypothetical protein J3R83DRAFT_4622 [Lanmaoa asiatica]